MQLTSIFAFCILLLSPLISPGQTVANEGYESRLMTVQEGLPDRTVLRVEQDRSGLMWFITSAGVSSYNGIEYNHYGMPRTAPEYVARVLFNRNDEVFVLVNTGEIYKLQSTGYERVHPDAASNVRSCRELMFDSAGQAWALSRDMRHLAIFDSTWTLVKEMSCWARRPDLYFNIRHKSYFRSNNDGTSLYVHTDFDEVTGFDTNGNVFAVYKLPGLSLTYDYFTEFFADENSNVHLICPGGVVWSIDRENNPLRHYSRVQHRVGTYPVYVDRAGETLYFGQYWHELIKFDLGTGASSSFKLDTEGYPPASETYHITESKTGNIWVSGDLGITIFNERASLFESYDLDGVPRQAVPGAGIRSIRQTPQGIFFSTDHYPFYQLDPTDGTIAKVGDESGIKVAYPSFFHGMVYKDDVLYSVNGTQFNLHTKETAPASVSLQELVVEFDAEGRYYTLGNSGFRVFERPGGALLDSVLCVVGGRNIIPDANGGIWICTYIGLFQYRYGEGIVRSIVSDGEAVMARDDCDSNFIEGLQSLITNDVAFTEGGGIWVATSEGLHRVDTVKGIVHYYDELDLPGNVIYSILPEGDSILWLGTSNGLVRYRIGTTDFLTFTTEDGLPHNEFNRMAKLKAADGFYYMGGIDGICRFDPADVVRRNALQGAPLRFEGVSIFDGRKTRTVNAQYGAQSDPVALSPDDDLITFRLALADYLDPERNEYRYSMTGLSPDWGDWTAQNTVTFQNLPPGEYTFIAQARGSNRLTSANEIRIPVTVRESFFSTIWFPILLVLLSSSLIYAIARYRFLQRLKLERLRTRIASDLHDEVGGVLSGIAMQMDLLKTRAPDEIRPRIIRIAQSSRDAVSTMRDVIWSVDSSRDTVEDLLERMKAYLNEILSPMQVVWEFDDRGVDHGKSIKPLVRQNVYLIFKEAITNISKHSSATEVVIQIRSHDRKDLRMNVRDNGGGFDPETVNKGDGLRNMQRRADDINASLTMEFQHGVSIDLIVPGFEK